MSHALSDPSAQDASNQTVAMLLAESCRQNGIEIVFGQSNPILFHVAAPGAGIRNIVYRTENSGGIMADGYARISRRVPLVTAQNGPAATLLVAPLAEALRSSIPIVALVQEVPASTRDRNAFQELDHFQLFAGCTKWIRRADDPSRVQDYLDMAFRAASSGRCGPAVLLVGADVFRQTARAMEPRQSYGNFPLDPVCPSHSRIMEAADLLAAAHRPVVIAGGGIHLSGAAEVLAHFQEDCHMPVATTQMGKGAVAEDHPLSIGVIGYLMGPGNPAFAALPLVSEADVVLLVGTRTAQNGTDAWSQYPKTAKFIHIDIDSQEVGRNYEAAVRLVGDAKLTLEALYHEFRGRDLAMRHDKRAGVEQAIAHSIKAARDLTQAVCQASRVPIRPERLMAELDQLLDPSTIVVADASHASIWISLYLRSRRPGMRFLQPRGLAGLGWGVPMAVGAKLAAPASKVIAVVGDGGFAHCWADLEVLRRHQLPITIIVLNNQILASQHQVETVVYGVNTDTGFCPVDHAAIARACGVEGIRIERPEQIADALRKSLASDKSTLLDVIVEPTARPPMRQFQNLSSQFD
jgi:acetolactate synthase I/II/III large subunit